MPDDKPRIPITDEPGLAGGPGPAPPGIADETPLPYPAAPETPEVPRPRWSGGENEKPPEGEPDEPGDAPRR
ncbi:hypothetical protein [Anaeromyxobacter oryzae]|uniref:Uncharacterized protein n=1 Tax=Anaeromyxobacter oryzae TaxID=2918170 RepID=A0ABM7WUJ2_9BACT|nr:hypothetical protein [Anaeromyxobacter oryzae]BDG03164.1 hypothetical protein AMOR_21600 [Anaeromyxobacter oryzae]